MTGPRPSFDTTHAIRFDLARGAVQASKHDERLLLVPSSALDDLILSASAEAVDALARSMGAAIGRRAAARLAADGAGDGSPAAVRASVDDVVTQIAGEAALAGVGSFSLERWGRAMVAVLENSPLPAVFLPPLVAAALESAAGRAVACMLLERDERVARVLVASESAVARVRDRMADGAGWSEAIAALHGGRS
jgi:hypothetical protein